MIQLQITETAKGYSPTAEWQTLDVRTESFPTREAAETWIAETYGKRKRTKMYAEREGQPDFVCGYVIGFRNADWSHAPLVKWLQQDWIQFREVKTINIDN